MLEILLSKDFLLFSGFFILLMTFSLVGLLGAISRHLLMPTGYSLRLKEYRNGAAIFWGLLFFLGLAIFPTLLFSVITKDNLSFTQTLIYLLVLLVTSLVFAVLAKKWLHISHKTNFSGEGIRWGYKVVMLILVTIPLMAVSMYPPSYLSISLTLLLFILGVVLPYINIYATWWIFTLGGRLPLPQQHAWIAPDKKASQKEYIKALSASLPLILVLSLLGRNLALDTIFVFLKPLAWFVIFHIGMTLAVLIKGKNITAQSNNVLN